MLHGIDLHVPAGQTLALVGPTGSGKSTLTTLLVRLVDPTSGRVTLDGVDLREGARGAVAAQAALVPQQTFLFDDTVRANITLGDPDLEAAGDEAVWAALRRAQVDGFVAGLPQGLDTRVGERGTTLSGGQRQRIALARALVRAPRLLVLDDATSAVDPTVEAAILAGLREQGQQGATVVVVAYRKATIALADQVAYVEHGRLVDRGTHEELLARNDALPPAGRRLRARGRRAGRPDGRRGGVDVTVTAAPGAATPSIESHAHTVRATVRRGLQLSPEILRGSRTTLALGLLSTLGRVVVPLAVQQTVDSGIQAGGGPDVRRVTLLVVGAAVAVVVTAVSAYAVNIRLFRSTEAGLMSLRVTAFRHVHDLSVLTQNAERRGSMVSRVTSDVDTISQFVQFGGLQLLLSIGQLLVATVLMAIYSPLLTVLVWLCFAPMLVGARFFQRGVSVAYAEVRERVAGLLGAVSEAVVGAATVRAYAVERRTQERVDLAVQAHRRAAIRAQTRVALTFSAGVLCSGLTTAVVVVVGTWLGAHGRISLGELLAFLFLVQLFTSPVQTATDVLNELQNAVAGWRRVIAVVETPADVADPGAEGQVLPRGPITVAFDHVTYAYPGGPPVLHDIDVTLPPSARVAVVGETGSGKTTFAKLLTRLMDPDEGSVLLDGVDLRELSFASLRERVVLVPQEGFLFEGTVLDNLRFSRPGATLAQVRLALTELGLLEWADGLPHALDTEVGQRGESLSAGERQLVSLTRAYLADPDLLVLDEATSSVDPATEVRIQRALDSLTRGRTAISIAHRLSTAEAADEVLVMDGGRLVERGPSAVLARAGGRYAELHASWTAQRRAG